MTAVVQKPRGKCTPFAFFVNQCESHLAKKHPEKGVDMTQLGDLCWERWQKMSGMEKKRFIQLSQCDVTRHDNAMVEYDQAKKAQQKERAEQKKKEKAAKKAAEKEKKSKKKDPNAPKKPMSAYFFFANELRPKLKVEKPELSILEQSKEAGRRWGAMDSAAKAKYESMAAEDKQRYVREMAAHKDKVATPAPVSVENKEQSGSEDEDSE